VCRYNLSIFIFYLFICFLSLKPFIPYSVGICRDPPPSALRCAQNSGYEFPLTKGTNKERRVKRNIYQSGARGALSSSASQTIHSSTQAALVSSSSSPFSITLPTSESSRNLRSLFSHRGLASKTRAAPGSLPSHAFSRAALILSYLFIRILRDAVHP
jgi:hypothetical protein